MVTRKDLIIAVLATFCLTATLFMIIPTKSNPGISPQYDPWVDINDDGTIDIFDAINLAGTFGTSGDPTKNVNVTNWPMQQPEPTYKLLELAMNYSWSNYLGLGGSDRFYIGGFSRMFVYIQPSARYDYLASPGNYSVTISLHMAYWCTSGGTIDGFESFPYNHSQITVYVVNGKVLSWGTQEFHASSYVESKGPYVQLLLISNSTISSGWVMTTIYAYLRNE